MTDQAASGVERSRSRDTAKTVSFRGQNISILVHGDETDDEFAVIDYEAPEGTAPPPHRHDFAEVFFILEGDLEVKIGDRTVQVAEGQAAYIPPGAAHAPRSEEHVRVLVLAVPAGIEQYFEEAMEIIEAHDGPVTMEALGDQILPLMKKYTMEPVGGPPQE